MKRRIVLAAISLLAGAVVNVVVAWGIANWIDVEDQILRSQFDYAGWNVWIIRRPGAIRVYRSDLVTNFPDRDSTPRSDPPSGLPSWSLANDPPTAPPVQRMYYDIEDARGWPFHSLRCGLDMFTILARQEDPFVLQSLSGTYGASYRIYLDGAGDGVSAGILISAQRLATRLDFRALPLRPIRPGFAVNTFFYAGILWLLIPGPFALRRLIRRRRGLCPKCAYPMGESEVCTECGRDLPKRVRPAT